MAKISVFLVVAVFIICGCSSIVKGPASFPSSPAVGKILPEKKPSSRIVLPFTLVSEEEIPDFTDDMDKESLSAAIEKSLEYYRRIVGKVQYRIGDSLFGVEDLEASLLTLQDILSRDETDHTMQSLIREKFDVYLSTGFAGNNSALFTGYFEPLLRGSLMKTGKFIYPVYRTPEDILRIKRVSEGFGEEEFIVRMESGKLIPYYSRSQIDNEGVLAGKNLEMIWIDDPVALFFLHIQGSGKIELENGQTRRIGYALKNGRPYRSIGNYMLQTGKITPEGNSYQKIKRYLREHPEERSEILGQNESYVFFRFVERGPVGSIGVVLTPGRSIAADASAFPPGALAFIQTRKPDLDSKGDVAFWKPFSRFVISQDAGSAIKGAGRVDLFCGSGTEAEMLAGSLKENGKLYFLLKKKCRN
jgi:membrane-bound lytic murein transglycosylase A